VAAPHNVAIDRNRPYLWAVWTDSRGARAGLYFSLIIKGL
jgi:hypothetical protein